MYNNLISFFKHLFQIKSLESETIKYPYRYPLTEPEIKKEKSIKIKKERKPMKLSFWHKAAASVTALSVIVIVVGWVHDTNLGSGIKFGSTMAAVLVGITLLAYNLSEGTKLNG